MTLYTNLQNPRQACYELEHIISDTIGRMTARPWNMYAPESSSWWLIPSTDWPAYKYGKLSIDWVTKEGRWDAIFMSLYFEKGLGASLAPLYPCARGAQYIMRRDWSWLRLIKDLKTGHFQTSIAQLAHQLPTPLRLHIDGGYVNDPCDFDPYETVWSDQWSRYYFELDALRQQFRLFEHVDLAEPFESLQGLRTLDDLCIEMCALNANPWLWVDLYVGIELRIDGSAKAPARNTTWKADDCWEQFIHPLSEWLV